MGKIKTHKLVTVGILGALVLSGCLNLSTKLSTLDGCTISLNGVVQNQQVRQAIIGHTKLSLSNLRDACNDAAKYSCSKKVFSPEIANQNSAATECAHSDSLGSPCLSVSSISFNTREAAVRAPADALEAGGIYNYTEYSCYNQAATDGKSFPASGIQQDSLDKALQSAFDKCIALSAAEAS